MPRPPQVRCCPECGVERPSAEFVSVPVDRRPPRAGGRWVRCPSCGHMAPRWAFKGVDPDDGTEGGEG
jgi:hypothetical protein